MAPEGQYAAEVLEEELEGPFYTRSTGQRVRLANMATPHLKSALAKLAREWPGHPEIAPMAAEAESRDAEAQAFQPEVQA